MPKTKVKLWDYSKAVFQVIHSHENNSKQNKKQNGHCMKAQAKRFINTSGISGYHDRGFQ